MKYTLEEQVFDCAHCILEKGESLYCEPGVMLWKTPSMQMSTGVVGGVWKALSRLVTGDELFLSTFTAVEDNSQIVIGTKGLGTIIRHKIKEGESIIIQKGSYLASSGTIEPSVHFQKNILTGLFGGEGFVLTKLSGRGVAFLEVYGRAVSFYLDVGQSIEVSTDRLVSYDSTCRLEIKRIKGISNMIFGNEGIFNTIVTGPGNVTIQTASSVGFKAEIIKTLSEVNRK